MADTGPGVHHRPMVRIALAAWVLFSFLLCIALGHLFRSSRRTRIAGVDPHRVAHMLRRGGFHDLG